MRKVLIAGHGISGAMLAHTLQKRGVDVWVADDPDYTGASRVAAGVISPVTGKRYVKTWRFEEFWDCAEQTYRALELELGIRFLRKRDTVRLLGSVGEANNWSARCSMPGYEAYLTEATDAGFWQPWIRPGHFSGRILKAAQIDYKILCDALLQRLTGSDRFIPQRLNFTETSKQAGDYDVVVFCEGADGAANPFFPEIKWQSAKGEGLLIEFLDPELQALLHDGNNPVPMLKKDLTIAAPGGAWEGLCWVGATFSWNYTDKQPTEAGRQQIETSLQKFVRAPYKIVDRFAGIRPVVTDRRPVLGQSRANPKIYIFNALGAKGGLLAPYWAGHLADHLLLGSALDPETDVKRFYALNA